MQPLLTGKIFNELQEVSLETLKRNSLSKIRKQISLIAACGERNHRLGSWLM